MSGQPPAVTPNVTSFTTSASSLSLTSTQPLAGEKALSRLPFSPPPKPQFPRPLPPNPLAYLGLKGVVDNDAGREFFQGGDDDILPEDDALSEGNKHSRREKEFHFVKDPFVGMPNESGLFNQGALDELREYFLKRIKVQPLTLDDLLLEAMLESGMDNAFLVRTVNRLRVEQHLTNLDFLAQIAAFAEKYSGKGPLPLKSAYWLSYYGLNKINGIIAALGTTISELSSYVDRTVDEQALLDEYVRISELYQAGLADFISMRHRLHGDHPSALPHGFKLVLMKGGVNRWGFVLDNGQFLFMLDFPKSCGVFFDFDTLGMVKFCPMFEGQQVGPLFVAVEHDVQPQLGNEDRRAIQCKYASSTDLVFVAIEPETLQSFHRAKALPNFTELWQDLEHSAARTLRIGAPL